MGLRERINEEIKMAMKAREAETLSTLRLLLSAVKQREVDERITLDDAGVIGGVEKRNKQRKDSIEQFEKAGRQELADQEMAEMALLQGYLPAQLSHAEIDAAIAEAIAASGAKSPADMGKVMGLVKAKVAGKADMGRVSALIKARLAG